MGMNKDTKICFKKMEEEVNCDMNQSVRLSWANPFKFCSSNTSPSANPVVTLKVMTLLGGGLVTIACKLEDIGPTSSSEIRPVPKSSWAIPSAVSFMG